MSHVPCHPASPAAHPLLLSLFPNLLRRINARQEALVTPEVVPLAEAAARMDVFGRQIPQDVIAVLLHALIEDDVGVLHVAHVDDLDVFARSQAHAFHGLQDLFLKLIVAVV